MSCESADHGACGNSSLPNSSVPNDTFHHPIVQLRKNLYFEYAPNMREEGAAELLLYGFMLLGEFC